MDDEQLSSAFAALADPTRRDLVARLAAGEASIGELAAPYDMSLQAVSKHVTVLERAGLVAKTRSGQRRTVRLDAQVLDLMSGWIARYQRQVEERYQRLDDVLTGLDADGTPVPRTDPRTDTHTDSRRDAS